MADGAVVFKLKEDLRSSAGSSKDASNRPPTLGWYIWINVAELATVIMDYLNPATQLGHSSARLATISEQGVDDSFTREKNIRYGDIFLSGCTSNPPSAATSSNATTPAYHVEIHWWETKRDKGEFLFWK